MTNRQWCSYSYTKKEERKEKSKITKETRCTHTFAIITSCFMCQVKKKKFSVCNDYFSHVARGL